MVCCDITRIGSRCSDRGILAQLYTHIDDRSDELCLRLVLCWSSASRVPRCAVPRAVFSSSNPPSRFSHDVLALHRAS